MWTADRIVMLKRRPHPIGAALLLVSALLLATPLMAQEDEPPRRWKLDAEVAGNVFFGNTRQMIATTRLDHEVGDSAWRSRSSLNFNYGQTRNDSNVVDVTKRSWLAQLALDWRPYEPVVPFVEVAFERSLEKRIDRRLLAGSGVRVALVRRPSAEASISVGAISERTHTLDEAAGNPGNTVARGSTTLQGWRDIGERVRLTSKTVYRPALNDPDSFTLTSEQGFRYAMSERFTLAVLARDSYDSKARARGARTNNDVELTLGISAAFH